MYDVIVVGAGPAGCTAAKILAESGCKVLLTEKFKLPRYKSCSGQLIEKTLKLTREYFGSSVPGSVTCSPSENRGMVFTDDKGSVSRFEQSGLNVWRGSFDNWLAELAVKAGAELRDETSAVAAEDNGSEVSMTLKGRGAYTERTRYVIDCEGAVGALKAKLTGAKTPYILTYQTFNQGKIELDHHYFYAFLQSELSEYDAWFNVKDDMLVLGVAVKNKSKVGDCYAKFISYMEQNHGLNIDKQLNIDRWIMPHIRPGCAVDYGVGNVLFAGETAGFLNPMGEGVSAAMESGYHAAVAVINNFGNSESVRSDYKNGAAALHDYMKRQWNLIARMTDTFKEMKN